MDMMVSGPDRLARTTKPSTERVCKVSDPLRSIIGQRLRYLEGDGVRPAGRMSMGYGIPSPPSSYQQHLPGHRRYAYRCVETVACLHANRPLLATHDKQQINTTSSTVQVFNYGQVVRGDGCRKRGRDASQVLV